MLCMCMQRNRQLNFPGGLGEKEVKQLRQSKLDEVARQLRLQASNARAEAAKAGRSGFLRLKPLDLKLRPETRFLLLLSRFSSSCSNPCHHISA